MNFQKEKKINIFCILICFYGKLIIFAHLISHVDAVDCVWGEYGEWSTCSATCGGGTRTRTRPEDTLASNGGSPCTGLATETDPCNPDACPSRKIYKSILKQVLNKKSA